MKSREVKYIQSEWHLSEYTMRDVITLLEWIVVNSFCIPIRHCDSGSHQLKVRAENQNQRNIMEGYQIDNIIFISRNEMMSDCRRPVSFSFRRLLNYKAIHKVTAVLLQTSAKSSITEMGWTKAVFLVKRYHTHTILVQLPFMNLN